MAYYNVDFKRDPKAGFQLIGLSANQRPVFGNFLKGNEILEK